MAESRDVPVDSVPIPSQPQPADKFVGNWFCFVCGMWALRDRYRCDYCGAVLIYRLHPTKQFSA